MRQSSVLIAGAGIAGPALAFWLARRGMQATVVERAAGLRIGGQSIDIRGAAKEVVRRMGLEDAIRARTTGERGVAFVDRDNRTRASFGSEAFAGEGFVADIEILRGELSSVFFEATCHDAEYIFGDCIRSLSEQDKRAQVTFASGKEREFDLVVAADGMRSKTRALMFPGVSPMVELGQYMSYFTIPRHASDGSWARWCNVAGGRCMLLRPDNLGTTRALMSFMSPPLGYESLAQPEQKQLLHRLFANAGWMAPRMLDGLDAAEDFYFEHIGQVKMDVWSKGRFALLGDAGYCASPISGMGTSLAIVGAYLLARALARHPRHVDAFAAYEKRMRPYVRRAQRLPPGAPRIAAPQTRLGILLLYQALHFVSKPRIMRLFSRLTPPANSIHLPAQ